MKVKVLSVTKNELGECATDVPMSSPFFASYLAEPFCRCQPARSLPLKTMLFFVRQNG